MVTTTLYRPRLSKRVFSRDLASDRWLERRITLTWGLLVLNVLTFDPGTSVLHIPSTVGKLITQGALPLALLLALTLNRKLVLRPNVFLFLTTLLVVETIMTFPAAAYLRGTGYRTFRFVEFVAALWLLSPYWGRRDLLFVRCHLKVMGWVIGSVILGLIVAPSQSLNGGRLIGTIWPIPSTQVAHYAAVTLGMTLVLWFCSQRRGRETLVILALTVTILLLSHTRTAIVAMIAGVLVAGLSLIAARPRVRRLFIALTAMTVAVALTSANAIISWMERGQQNNGQLTDLSGRTNFWSAILAEPRTKFQEIFGFGISNGTFNGQPVDSNWMISYQDQGLFGVVVCAMIIIFLLVAASFESRNLNRALALFLVVYCLIASFTEVGFTGASPYLLDLVVAASLLVPAADETDGDRWKMRMTDRLVQS